MGGIINFPDSKTAWGRIESNLRQMLGRAGMPENAATEITDWTKAMFDKYSTPSVVIYTPEEVQKFYLLLQEQKFNLLLDALWLKIETYANRA